MQDDAKSSTEASKALNGQGRQHLKTHTFCVDGIIAVSVLFCGMLLACHVGLGPCPSVSEASENPNFPNLTTKTFNKNHCSPFSQAISGIQVYQSHPNYSQTHNDTSRLHCPKGVWA